MEANIIGQRYAKALLQLAGDQAGTVGEELSAIAGLYAESTDLQSFIAEPTYNKDKKIEVIGEVVKQAGASDLVIRFSRYLTFKGRFEIIVAIAANFEQLANEKLGKAKASMTVAFEMEQKEIDAMAATLSSYTGKSVSVDVKVDPSIIGGAITKIGSLVLDGSVQNRLNLIRKTISKGA